MPLTARNLEIENHTVSLCLVSDIEYSFLADLLNGLYQSGDYKVHLDLSRVERLGTVEFRVLGSFAEMFKRRGGFLKLDNASEKVAGLVRVFGFSELISGTNGSEAGRSENPAQK